MIQRQKDRKITVSSLKFMRLKIGVVMALFNTDITEKLLQGALKELDALGVREENIIILQVPGSFEIPLAVKALILEHQPDAVVCLGALIKGETDHYQYLASEVSRGIGQVGLEFQIPVAFGVLTTHNLEQALERAGGIYGNKGAEAARAAVQMVKALRKLSSEEADEKS